MFSEPDVEVVGKPGQVNRETTCLMKAGGRFDLLTGGEWTDVQSSAQFYSFSLQRFPFVSACD